MEENIFDKTMSGILGGATNSDVTNVKQEEKKEQGVGVNTTEVTETNTGYVNNNMADAVGGSTNVQNDAVIGEDNDNEFDKVMNSLLGENASKAAKTQAPPTSVNTGSVQPSSVANGTVAPNNVKQQDVQSGATSAEQKTQPRVKADKHNVTTAVKKTIVNDNANVTENDIQKMVEDTLKDVQNGVKLTPEKQKIYDAYSNAVRVETDKKVIAEARKENASTEWVEAFQASQAALEKYRKTKNKKDYADYVSKFDRQSRIAKDENIPENLRPYKLDENLRYMIDPSGFDAGVLESARISRSHQNEKISQNITDNYVAGNRKHQQFRGFKFTFDPNLVNKKAQNVLNNFGSAHLNGEEFARDCAEFEGYNQDQLISEINRLADAGVSKNGYDFTRFMAACNTLEAKKWGYSGYVSASKDKHNYELKLMSTNPTYAKLGAEIGNTDLVEKWIQDAKDRVAANKDALNESMKQMKTGVLAIMKEGSENVDAENWTREMQNTAPTNEQVIGYCYNQMLKNGTTMTYEWDKFFTDVHNRMYGKYDKNGNLEEEGEAQKEHEVKSGTEYVAKDFALNSTIGNLINWAYRVGSNSSSDDVTGQSLTYESLEKYAKENPGLAACSEIAKTVTMEVGTMWLGGQLAGGAIKLGSWVGGKAFRAINTMRGIASDVAEVVERSARMAIRTSKASMYLQQGMTLANFSGLENLAVEGRQGNITYGELMKNYLWGVATGAVAGIVGNNIGKFAMRRNWGSGRTALAMFAGENASFISMSLAELYAQKGYIDLKDIIDTTVSTVPMIASFKITHIAGVLAKGGKISDAIKWVDPEKCKLQLSEQNTLKDEGYSRLAEYVADPTAYYKAHPEDFKGKNFGATELGKELDRFNKAQSGKGETKVTLETYAKVNAMFGKAVATPKVANVQVAEDKSGKKTKYIVQTLDDKGRVINEHEFKSKEKADALNDKIKSQIEQQAKDDESLTNKVQDEMILLSYGISEVAKTKGGMTEERLLKDYLKAKDDAANGRKVNEYQQGLIDAVDKAIEQGRNSGILESKAEEAKQAEEQQQQPQAENQNEQPENIYQEEGQEPVNENSFNVGEKVNFGDVTYEVSAVDENGNITEVKDADGKTYEVEADEEPVEEESETAEPAEPASEETQVEKTGQKHKFSVDEKVTLGDDEKEYKVTKVDGEGNVLEVEDEDGKRYGITDDEEDVVADEEEPSSAAVPEEIEDFININKDELRDSEAEEYRRNPNEKVVELMKKQAQQAKDYAEGKAQKPANWDYWKNKLGLKEPEFDYSEGAVDATNVPKAPRQEKKAPKEYKEEGLGEPVKVITDKKGRTSKYYTVTTTDKDGNQITEVVAFRDGRRVTSKTTNIDIPDDYEIDDNYIPEDVDATEIVGVHRYVVGIDGNVYADVVVKGEYGSDTIRVRFKKKGSGNVGGVEEPVKYKVGDKIRGGDGKGNHNSQEFSVDEVDENGKPTKVTNIESKEKIDLTSPNRKYNLVGDSMADRRWYDADYATSVSDLRDKILNLKSKTNDVDKDKVGSDLLLEMHNIGLDKFTEPEIETAKTQAAIRLSDMPTNELENKYKNVSWVKTFKEYRELYENELSKRENPGELNSVTDGVPQTIEERISALQSYSHGESAAYGKSGSKVHNSARSGRGLTPTKDYRNGKAKGVVYYKSENGKPAVVGYTTGARGNGGIYYNLWRDLTSKEMDSIAAAFEKKIPSNIAEGAKVIDDVMRTNNERYSPETKTPEAPKVSSPTEQNPNGRYQIPQADTRSGIQKTLDKFKNFFKHREGNGEPTAEEVIMENDPISKVLGKPRKATRAEQEEFVAKVKRQAKNHAETLIKELGVEDRFEIIEDTDHLPDTDKRKDKKGWTNTENGRMAVVIANHSSMHDVEETILHEAVGHYGLRKLFGKHFDTFLDNVYNHCGREVKEEIDRIFEEENDASKRRYKTIHDAIEEYLSRLAEKGVDDRAKSSIWSKIRSIFLDALHKIGFKDWTIDDINEEELRYILNLSYHNLKQDGYRNPFTEEESKKIDEAIEKNKGIDFGGDKYDGFLIDDSLLEGKNYPEHSRAFWLYQDGKRRGFVVFNNGNNEVLESDIPGLKYSKMQDLGGWDLLNKFNFVSNGEHIGNVEELKFREDDKNKDVTGTTLTVAHGIRLAREEASSLSHSLMTLNNTYLKLNEKLSKNDGSVYKGYILNGDFCYLYSTENGHDSFIEMRIAINAKNYKKIKGLISEYGADNISKTLLDDIKALERNGRKGGYIADYLKREGDRRLGRRNRRLPENEQQDNDRKRDSREDNRYETRNIQEQRHNNGNDESSLKFREGDEEKAYDDILKASEDAAKQDYGSGGTSINGNKLPSGFGLVEKVGGFKEGTTNLDMGGGRFDNAIEMLAGKGVRNLVFDPFNRSKEYNASVAEEVRANGVDTTICNNCLNVINTKGARSNVILQCAKALKPGGVSYFTVYEGNKSGVGKVSKNDCWQENRPTADYIDEIKEHYGDVQRKGQLIIAKEPITDGKVSVWNYDASGDEGLRFREGDGTNVKSHSFKNVNGTTIERGGKEKEKNGGRFHPVGKMPYPDWFYFHKDYALDYVSKENLDKAIKALPEGFTYNTMMWRADKPNIIRFDETPNFDTAREPIPYRQITVDMNTGEIIRDRVEKQIFHHKWQWVDDDYKGFDVAKEIEWSKEWTSKIKNTPTIGRLKEFNRLLDEASLPVAMESETPQGDELHFREGDESLAELKERKRDLLLRKAEGEDVAKEIKAVNAKIKEMSQTSIFEKPKAKKAEPEEETYEKTKWSDVENMLGDNVDDYVMYHLGNMGKGLKVKWNDSENGTKGLGGETGLSSEERKGKKFANDRSGSTPAEIAEKMWNDAPAQLKNKWDSEDFRNSVIDALTSYGSATEIKNALLEKFDESARKYFEEEKEAEREEHLKEVMKANHLDSIYEAEAFEEVQDRDDFLNAVGDEELRNKIIKAQAEVVKLREEAKAKREEALKKQKEELQAKKKEQIAKVKEKANEKLEQAKKEIKVQKEAEKALVKFHRSEIRRVEKDHKEEIKEKEKEIRELKKASELVPALRERLETEKQKYKNVKDYVDAVAKIMREEISPDVKKEMGAREFDSMIKQIKDVAKSGNSKKIDTIVEDALNKVKSVATRIELRMEMRDMDDLAKTKVQHEDSKRVQHGKKVDAGTITAMNVINEFYRGRKLNELQNERLKIEKQLEDNSLDTDKRNKLEARKSELEKQIADAVDANKKLIPKTQKELLELKDEIAKARAEEDAGNGEMTLEQKGTEKALPIIETMFELREKLDEAAKSKQKYDEQIYSARSIKLEGTKEINEKIRKASEELDVLKGNGNADATEISNKETELANLREEKRKIQERNRKKLNEKGNKVETAKATLAESQANTLDALEITKDVNRQLKELLETGHCTLLDIMEAKNERRKQLLKIAWDAAQNEAPKGRGHNEQQRQVDQARVHRIKHNPHRFLTAGVEESFEFMTKVVDRNHLTGDSGLHRRLVEDEKRGVVAARRSFLKGMEEIRETREKANEEFFGRKEGPKDANEKITYTEYYESEKVDENGQPTGETEVTEVSNIIRKGQALSIYLWSRSQEGRDKLAAQGITEESVKQIKAALGENWVKFGDWVVDKFLPELYKKYNAKHIELNGISLTKNENYFPFRIFEGDIREGDKLNDFKNAQIDSTVIDFQPSALKERTKNNYALNTTADAFGILDEHVKSMEDWYHFADFREDLNTLFHDHYFKTLVTENNETLYYAFYRSARIASGLWDMEERKRPKNMEDRLLKAMSQLVSSTITFKFYTAMKQAQSIFAGLGQIPSASYYKNFVKNCNPYNAIRSFLWLKENSPIFRERLRNGDLGSMALADKFGKNRYAVLEGLRQVHEVYQKLGMAPNKGVDGVTCAIIAKSVYDTRMSEYKKLVDSGDLTAEQAHNRAMIEAEIAFNQTQQSTEASFRSYAQSKKTLWFRGISTYQTGPIGYLRKTFEGIMNINRAMKIMFGKGLKGYNKSQAVKGALGGVGRQALFGEFLNITWTMCSMGICGMTYNAWKHILPRLTFGLAGGNDDEKKLKDDEGLQSLYFDEDDWKTVLLMTTCAPMTGTWSGNMMNSIISGYDYNPNMIISVMGETTDSFLKKFKEEYKAEVSQLNKPAIAITANAMLLTFLKTVSRGDVGGKVLGRFFGVNLDTWDRIYQGIGAAIDKGKIDWVDVSNVLNTPRSSMKKFAKDYYLSEGAKTKAKDLSEYIKLRANTEDKAVFNDGEWNSNMRDIIRKWSYKYVDKKKINEYINDWVKSKLPEYSKYLEGIDNVNEIWEQNEAWYKRHGFDAEQIAKKEKEFKAAREAEEPSIDDTGRKNKMVKKILSVIKKNWIADDKKGNNGVGKVDGYTRNAQGYMKWLEDLEKEPGRLSSDYDKVYAAATGDRMDTLEVMKAKEYEKKLKAVKTTFKGTPDQVQQDQKRLETELNAISKLYKQRAAEGNVEKMNNLKKDVDEILNQGNVTSDSFKNIHKAATSITNKKHNPSKLDDREKYDKPYDADELNSMYHVKEMTNEELRALINKTPAGPLRNSLIKYGEDTWGKEGFKPKGK